MKKLLITFFITLLFTGCSTLKVDVDYDENFDFSKHKTFFVKHKNLKGENTLTNDRIISAIEKNLQLKNYKKTSEDIADLIFVFHISVKDKTQIQPNYQVGIGRYGRYGGTMISTTSSYDYKEGTLIIDALNPKDKKTLWRGTGITELNKNSTTRRKKRVY